MDQGYYLNLIILIGLRLVFLSILTELFVQAMLTTCYEFDDLAIIKEIF